MSRSCIVVLLSLLLLVWNGHPVFAQRTYASRSVLATGNWYRIAVDSPGIYRMDLAFLASLGVNTASLSSASIRLYGHGGAMLPEQPSGAIPPDLPENALWIDDGGDGVLNGADQVLFYAPGPHQWLKDSANRRFRYQQNRYSNRAYYYLSIGGSGKRITSSPSGGSAGNTITRFQERYAHELDTFNFLSSGREWYGEEFSDAPGRTLQRRWDLVFPPSQQ